MTWMPRPRDESGHFCFFLPFVAPSMRLLACSHQCGNDTRGPLMHRTAEGDGPREGPQGASIPDLTSGQSTGAVAIGSAWAIE